MTDYELDAVDHSFVRIVIMVLVSALITKARGLSFRKDGLFVKNWKPLLANGLSGAIGIILLTLMLKFLPLTIAFVIICTQPFLLGILAYFYLGESMATVSVIAAILSFGAILMLSFAKPESDDVQEEFNYVLGVGLSLIAVLFFCIIKLTIRKMQDVDPFLIMKSYNTIAALATGVYLIVRSCVEKELPLVSMMIWTRQSAMLFIFSVLSHLVAQLTTFYAFHKA